MRLVEIVQLDFEILVVDGMRIGGSGGELEIGGTVDANLTALRDPVSGEPYIPGSSLKGKLRSLAESVNGTFRMIRAGEKEERKESRDGSPCGCGQRDCVVCTVFGAHMNTRAQSSPTRIRVRDAHLTAESKEIYKEIVEKTGQYFEQKTENLVNRRSGTAEHPRTGERVPPGARFEAHIVLRVYDDDQKKVDGYLNTIKQALGLLETADSLGASGSRGFGTIRLENLKLTRQNVANISVQFETA
jgi:CRISPR-associated protein Csm3